MVLPTTMQPQQQRNCQNILRDIGCTCRDGQGAPHALTATVLPAAQAMRVLRIFRGRSSHTSDGSAVQLPPNSLSKIRTVPAETFAMPLIGSGTTMKLRIFAMPRYK